MQVWPSWAWPLVITWSFRDTLQTNRISRRTSLAFPLWSLSSKISSNLTLWFHQGILKTLAARLKGSGETLLTPPSGGLAGCGSRWYCC